MVEFYGCASKINLAHNHRLRPRAWLTIGRTLKKVSCRALVYVQTSTNCSPNASMTCLYVYVAMSPLIFCLYFCSLLFPSPSNPPLSPLPLTVSLLDDGKCQLLCSGGADADTPPPLCEGQLLPPGTQDGGKQPHREGNLHPQ